MERSTIATNRITLSVIETNLALRAIMDQKLAVVWLPCKTSG